MTTRIDMSKVALWRKEFGGAYQVPAEIEAAVSAGLLVDVSWHNDVCPCFVAGEEDNDGNFPVRLWVEHPDTNQREFQGPDRFLVDNCGESRGLETVELSTNDVNEALAKVQELLDKGSRSRFEI